MLFGGQASAQTHLQLTVEDGHTIVHAMFELSSGFQLLDGALFPGEYPGRFLQLLQFPVQVVEALGLQHFSFSPRLSSRVMFLFI